MKTDNELIAEFMDEPLTFTHDMGREVVERKLNYEGYYNEWNNLMPVVEKIDDLDNGKYIVTIEPMITIISNMGEAPIVECQFGGRIENTYRAVVEFIKWYNSNPELLK